MRLIDADELKRKMEDLVFYRGNIVIEIIDALHKVDECQTVDAEPVKQAHWIEGNEDHVSCDSICYYTCSECNHSFSDDTPYCPNCGALMDGETV